MRAIPPERSDSRIREFDGGSRASVGEGPHQNLASRRRELHGVTKEVPEDLPQPGRVREHEHAILRTLAAKDQLLRIRLRAADLHHVVESLGEQHGLGLDLELPARDSRQVEQIVDQPRLELGVAAHDLDGMTELFGKSGVSLEHRR